MYGIRSIKPRSHLASEVGEDEDAEDEEEVISCKTLP